MINHEREYHTPGSTTRRPKNAIFLSEANSTKHELAKCVAALMVKKTGDVYLSKIILSSIEVLASQIDWELKGQGESHDFITEAVPENRSQRRIDLVDLNNGNEFEFETDHEIKKEGAVTIYL